MFIFTPKGWRVIGQAPRGISALTRTNLEAKRIVGSVNPESDRAFSCLRVSVFYLSLNAVEFPGAILYIAAAHPNNLRRIGAPAACFRLGMCSRWNATFRGTGCYHEELLGFHRFDTLKFMEVTVFSAKEVLDLAIRLEKNGEAIYRGAVEKLSDPNLSLLLEWMANEEAKHALCFSKMQRRLILEQSAPIADPIAEEMGRKLFDDLMAGQSFSLEDVDFSRIEHVDAMLAAFIEFEKDTILFYQMLEAFVQDPSALRELKQVIAEEERHVKELTTLLHRSPPEVYGSR
jgi:rubrerythrin